MLEDSILLHSYAVSLAEVPGELALTLNISNCPFRCKGCHTPELQTRVGLALSEAVLLDLLNRNKGITAVCFMGGDQHKEQLINLLDVVRSNDLKTCLYTGAAKISKAISGKLTFLKTGEYIDELGALGTDSTNQVFINLVTGDILNNKFKKSLA